MTDAAGVPPRSLQEFLSLFKWDEAALRDRMQRRVATRHGSPNSVGVIDETSFAKKGNRTACVPRQHCGSLGKLENCVVSVHLGYVAGDFHTLLDAALYLPDGPRPLLIARNVLRPAEVRFFLSNAPLGTPVETLLLVAFSRWRIERMFEDSKSELGLDHFEVRRYGSITRHPLWRRGGRCSRQRAETIAAPLAVTQQRNATPPPHAAIASEPYADYGRLASDCQTCTGASGPERSVVVPAAR
ncbi:MAG: transposase [Phycisphaerae bacterium]|nr:transposase [Planctomycetia bacterium]MCK6464822.1 transposase [Phycisphaerae bacterium]MCL4718392.1 transposase [Phycisphaerae bacterium]NUQ08696.1 transposase [Phycisphaerae bacterium]